MWLNVTTLRFSGSNSNFEKLTRKLNRDHAKIPKGNGLVLEIGHFSSPRFKGILSPTTVITDDKVVQLRHKVNLKAQYIAKLKSN